MSLLFFLARGLGLDGVSFSGFFSYSFLSGLVYPTSCNNRTLCLDGDSLDGFCSDFSSKRTTDLDLDLDGDLDVAFALLELVATFCGLGCTVVEVVDVDCINPVLLRADCDRDGALVELTVLTEGVRALPDGLGFLEGLAFTLDSSFSVSSS